jgi:hypothetical protein
MDVKSTEKSQKQIKPDTKKYDWIPPELARIIHEA